MSARFTPVSLSRITRRGGESARVTPLSLSHSYGRGQGRGSFHVAWVEPLARTSLRDSPLLQQHLVELPEFPSRPPAVPTRATCGGGVLRLVRQVDAGRAAFGAVHQADAVAVLAVALARHPDPRVVHPERLEDCLAH